MAVTEVGRLFTFGLGEDGQLGHGDTSNRNVPVEVGGARFRGARIVYAAAGYNHSGVVTSEGGVWTWGRGQYGQLGHWHNDEVNQPVPKEVEGGLGGAKAVMLAAGFAHTMVVTGDGALWGCGWGAHGQLGVGHRAGRWSPVRVGAEEAFGQSRVLLVPKEVAESEQISEVAKALYETQRAWADDGVPPMQMQAQAPKAALNDLIVNFFSTKGESNDAGCTIAETELRAITVFQLKDVRAHIERRCESEGWLNSLDQAKLTPATVHLYAANDYVIMVATSKRKCAYIELVAEGAQKPKWFCSHWWGEPVLDFVACVETHAEDHYGPPQLDEYDIPTGVLLPDEGAAYWLRAAVTNPSAVVTPLSVVVLRLQSPVGTRPITLALDLLR